MEIIRWSVAVAGTSFSEYFFKVLLLEYSKILYKELEEIGGFTDKEAKTVVEEVEAGARKESSS